MFSLIGYRMGGDWLAGKLLNSTNIREYVKNVKTLGYDSEDLVWKQYSIDYLSESSEIIYDFERSAKSWLYS